MENGHEQLNDACFGARNHDYKYNWTSGKKINANVEYELLNL